MRARTQSFHMLFVACWMDPHPWCLLKTVLRGNTKIGIEIKNNASKADTKDGCTDMFRAMMMDPSNKRWTKTYVTYCINN